MERADLAPHAGPPAQLRAELATQRGWANELDVLDAALDELTGRDLEPLLAVVWAVVEADGAPTTHALVWGDDGVAVAKVERLATSTTWYSRR